MCWVEKWKFRVKVVLAWLFFGFLCAAAAERWIMLSNYKRQHLQLSISEDTDPSVLLAAAIFTTCSAVAQVVASVIVAAKNNVAGNVKISILQGLFLLEPAKTQRELNEHLKLDRQDAEKKQRLWKAIKDFELAILMCSAPALVVNVMLLPWYHLFYGKTHLCFATITSFHHVQTFNTTVAIASARSVANAVMQDFGCNPALGGISWMVLASIAFSWGMAAWSAARIVDYVNVKGVGISTWQGPRSFPKQLLLFLYFALSIATHMAAFILARGLHNSHFYILLGTTFGIFLVTFLIPTRISPLSWDCMRPVLKASLALTISFPWNQQINKKQDWKKWRWIPAVTVAVLFCGGTIALAVAQLYPYSTLRNASYSTRELNILLQQTCGSPAHGWYLDGMYHWRLLPGIDLELTWYYDNYDKIPSHTTVLDPCHNYAFDRFSKATVAVAALDLAIFLATSLVCWCYRDDEPADSSAQAQATAMSTNSTDSSETSHGPGSVTVKLGGSSTVRSARKPTPV